MKDVWDNQRNPNGYTHFTAHGASRINRIYLSETLNTRKIATTLIIAGFTDHNAVQVKIKEQQYTPLRGMNTWKLNRTPRL